MSESQKSIFLAPSSNMGSNILTLAVIL